MSSIRAWLYVSAIGCVLAFLGVMALMAIVAFASWELPDPNWLRIARLSVGLGFGFALWVRADLALSKYLDRVPHNVESDRG